MTDRAAFAKLVRTLAPWGDRLVYIGGWAHRLYRLHPTATVPAYWPLTTLDADVAFAERENLEGNIKDRLLEAGFKEQLTGNHNPPVSQYILGDGDAGGFYAEFLTPLTGSGRTRQGEPLATVKNAGVTAQRLRYLDLLLESPWSVTLDEDWGDGMPMDLRIPNPVSFIVQKLLAHDQRLPGKKAQDLLYIHDTLELFAPELDGLGALWRDVLRARLHENQVRSAIQMKNQLFGQLDDRIRDAAAIPQDRQLDPERMRAMCFAALGELLE